MVRGHAFFLPRRGEARRRARRPRPRSRDASNREDYETLVLPPSEIGEVAVFARRSGKTWFLALMNGTSPKKVKVPLSFLEKGLYRATLLRDGENDTVVETTTNAQMECADCLTLDLRAGGGFLARFSR